MTRYIPLILAASLAACSDVPFTEPTKTEDLAAALANPVACQANPDTQACLEHRAVRACWLGLSFIATSLAVRDPNDFVEAARVNYLAQQLRTLRVAAETSPTLELDLATVRIAFQQVMLSIFGQGLSSLNLDLEAMIGEAAELLAENEVLTAGTALLRRKIRDLDEGRTDVKQSWAECDGAIKGQLAVLPAS